MSLWRGKTTPAEKRVQLPAWLAQAAVPSYKGVDLSTLQAPLQSVAIRSSVDLIASLASELPIDVFSGAGAARRQVDTPDHLLDPEGEGKGLQDWAYQVLVSFLLRGNVFGDVLERAPSGFMTQVSLHHPDCVQASMVDGSVQWRVSGQPVTDLSRFLHRRVNPIPGVVLGLSPIALHASMIGLSLTSTQFGLQWFTDGAHPSGMLTNTEVDLSEKKVADAVKDRFMAALQGREPVVFGKGWEYKQLQIAPEESQFIATQGLSAAESARIFGPGMAEILGYESGGSLTYANVESRLSHLLTLSLGKWFTRLERLLTEMLPRPQYARINRAALLQSTTLDRYRAHEIALRNKWKTPSEVRDDEDMPPFPDGQEDDDGKAKRLAEIVQKVYLGVGVVVSADEAREMVNAAGGDLTGPAPTKGDGT